MLEGSCPGRFCHLDQATLVVGVLEMNVESGLQMLFAQRCFFVVVDDDEEEEDDDDDDDDDVDDVAAQVHTRPSFNVLTGNLVAGESCLGKEKNDQRKAQNIEIYLSRGITICRSPESRGRQTCF